MSGVLLGACATFRSGNSSLPDDTWRLEELDGVGTRTSVDPARGPFLRFNEDKSRVTGAGGCNTFSGPYTHAASALHFGALVMTRMACADESLNRQESAFITALATIDHYEVSGSTLILYSGSRARMRSARRFLPSPSPMQPCASSSKAPSRT